jgi:hypothetical protein
MSMRRALKDKIGWKTPKMSMRRALKDKIRLESIENVHEESSQGQNPLEKLQKCTWASPSSHTYAKHRIQRA